MIQIKECQIAAVLIRATKRRRTSAALTARKHEDHYDNRAAYAGERGHDAGRQENQGQWLEKSSPDRVGYARVLADCINVGALLH